MTVVRVGTAAAATLTASSPRPPRQRPSSRQSPKWRRAARGALLIIALLVSCVQGHSWSFPQDRPVTGTHAVGGPGKRGHLGEIIEGDRCVSAANRGRCGGKA